MNIAFISYEYPPDTAIGGIATYVYQAAQLMQSRGNQVEVFAGSTYRSETQIEQGVLVHRIPGKNGSEFSQKIGQVFAKRHQAISFDVLEGPEATACAVDAVRLVPNIPLVVKLHTPMFLVEKMNYAKPSFQMKTRRYLGALRRGQKPQPFVPWHYNLSDDVEYLHTLDADEIVTPSRDLGNQLTETWHLPPEMVVHFPNPYTPSQALLNIPVETQNKSVTFIGRLEIRKGVLEFANAIPQILRQYPEVKIRFVGASCPSPHPQLSMRQYLGKKLRRYGDRVEFTEHVSPEQIPTVLSATDICVFPSRWENFPNVCLEAMAAARGVVGSWAGGMTEMLDGGRVGRLVPPSSPSHIAEAVIELLGNPQLRMQLGQAARDRVLSEYNQARIGALQEESYRRAIARRTALGSRMGASHSAASNRVS